MGFQKQSTGLALHSCSLTSLDSLWTVLKHMSKSKTTDISVLYDATIQLSQWVTTLEVIYQITHCFKRLTFSTVAEKIHLCVKLVKIHFNTLANRTNIGSLLPEVFHLPRTPHVIWNDFHFGNCSQRRLFRKMSSMFDNYRDISDKVKIMGRQLSSMCADPFAAGGS